MAKKNRRRANREELRRATELQKRVIALELQISIATKELDELRAELAQMQRRATFPSLTS